jgi:hypothetical protein
MKHIIEDTELDFIDDNDIKRSLRIGIDALNELDLWDWLRSFTLCNEMFVMKSHENLDRIEKYMFDHDDIHSGASFSLIMRNLKMIANYGWTTFVEYCCERQTT